MKGRKFIIGLGVIVILMAFGLVVISMKEKAQNKIVVKAENVHDLISKGDYFYEPEQLENDLNTSTYDMTIIDLRSPNQFLIDHIESAINVPFQRILDKENSKYFTSNNTKIIYTDEEAKSAEVWVLLKQLGYDNVYILKGGFNYWVDKIEHKDLLGPSTKNSEKAKYDFKKEMSPDE